jgi:cellobiose phosphorylase
VALVFASQRMLRLAEHLNDRPRVKLFKRIIDTMTRVVNENAWDGDHYVFGFNDDGVAIGSQTSEEGRIHAVTNGWTLFTGIAAAAGREEQVLEAMKRLWSAVGTATVDIPYTRKSRDLVGRMADMVPGQFENGSVYTHGHAFLLYALAVTGRADRLYSELKLSLPDNTFPDIATGAPHQQSNFAVGPSHPNHGMNLYSNFTGSANWYLKTIDRMIGVLPDFDGLRISPTAPPAWREYQVRKQFRGLDFHFHFDHAGGRSQVKAVTVNGRPLAPIDGAFTIGLAGLKPGRTIMVEVTM